MVSPKWTELGKGKLGSSGLTTADAKVLGMYEISSAITLHPSFKALPCLVIPYYDIDGEVASARPGWPAFYRIRYLGKGNSFADLATEKSQRYAQPPKTGICAYFPKSVPWKEISKKTSEDIYITEGELKAAAACAAGFNTIGLGGVWNFRMAGDGFFFLPELEKIKWQQRDVYIVYDSDYMDNPQICAAINRVAEELMERGAMPHVVLLPDLTEDGKTGLDDFLLSEPSEELVRLTEEAEPISLSRALWRINSDVLYVEDPGLVVVHSTGQKMSPAQFKEHSRWAAANTVEKKVSAEGTVVVKKVPAAPVWIRWPLRRSAARVTYSPGQPVITEDNEYNQWPGWGVEPEKGDVAPFLELVKYLTSDSEKGTFEWLMDWLAYPIQNPGTKMFSSVLVHGVEQGTGKSLLGYTMGRIYGKNFKEITDEDLEGGYTAWAENRQFVMGDEISGSDNRQFANMLKRLITQRSMTINVKYIPQYDVPDCINYYFTANHADAFFIDDKDRRNMIIEVARAPLSEKFYRKYDRWLWGSGPQHLFNYLLKYKISDKFNPAAAPPKTSAKSRMIRAGKGELSNWVSEMLEHPAQVLVSGSSRHTRDLFTTTELLSFYNATHMDNRVTSVGLGRALSNAGVPQAMGGQVLTAPDGKKNRYYIVRNIERWRKCDDRKKFEKNLSKERVRRVK